VCQALWDLDEKGGTDLLAWMQDQTAAHPEVLGPACFLVLMQREPARTMEWLQSLPASQSKACIAAAINRWSRVDPPGALAWLASQPADSLPTDLSRIGVCALADPPRFETWRKTLPPGEMRDRAGFALAQELVQRGRFSDAQQLFPRDGTTDWFLNSTVQLAREMANSDLSVATAWVNQIPPGPVQAMAAKGILDQWAGKAPAQAAQWAQTLPSGEARDTSMRTLATSFAAIDPESGSLWLEQISDPAIWSRGVKDLFRSWENRDPGRAREWLSQLPGIDNELKARLMQRRR
jgi:hypothetical protein